MSALRIRRCCGSGFTFNIVDTSYLSGDLGCLETNDYFQHHIARLVAVVGFFRRSVHCAARFCCGMCREPSTSQVGYFIFWSLIGMAVIYLRLLLLLCVAAVYEIFRAVTGFAGICRRADSRTHFSCLRADSVFSFSSIGMIGPPNESRQPMPAAPLAAHSHRGPGVATLTVRRQ